ncbi:hypothetical protein [Amycolatopsis taiwanensis]|uniref:hypothetical protein n=1 Tax=Amycolatopsis taiwanensis TaxID=342230 RepID=UPI0025549E1C|nr:hypothetical protein [Amycolatopsis taiwanensis]
MVNPIHAGLFDRLGYRARFPRILPAGSRISGVGTDGGAAGLPSDVERFQWVRPPARGGSAG